MKWTVLASSSHLLHILPGWDGLNTHVYQHKSWPGRPTRRNRRMLWLLCLLQCQGTCARQASVALGIWRMTSFKTTRNDWFISVLRLFSRSRRLPSWDVANYLYVVSRVQWGCVGHTCSNNHLRYEEQSHNWLCYQHRKFLIRAWYELIVLTCREDLHRDRCTQALPAAHIDLLNWDQDSQTYQGDQQFSQVGVRQILYHRC